MVGRPNVGKSTLVNADSRRRAHDHRPGSRHHTRCHRHQILNGKGGRCRLFDTAGLEAQDADGRQRRKSCRSATPSKAIRFAEIVVLSARRRASRSRSRTCRSPISSCRRAGPSSSPSTNGIWCEHRKHGLPSSRKPASVFCRRSRALPSCPSRRLPARASISSAAAVLAADALWNKRLPTHALNQWLRRGRRSAFRRPRSRADASSSDTSLRAMRGLRPSCCSARGRRRCPTPMSRYLVNSLRESIRHARRADQVASAQGRQPLCQGRMRSDERGSLTEVYFYHLERRTLEEVLPTLLERSLERGWRAAVASARARSASRRSTRCFGPIARRASLPHGTARDGYARGPSHLSHRRRRQSQRGAGPLPGQTARRLTMPRHTPAWFMCSTGATMLR